MISTADVLICIPTDSIAMFVFPQMLIGWLIFFLIFLVISSLPGMEWNLIAVSICISLTAKDLDIFKFIYCLFVVFLLRVMCFIHL